MEECSYVVAANLSLELITYWLGKVKPLPMTLPRRDLLNRILSYIDQHISETDLTPQKIADGCHISLRHLHRIFSATNTSVSRWITTLRLERCRQELSVPGQAAKTITDIAFRWGFNDASHFNRVFKRAFQVTPGQYRNGMTIKSGR
jgi:AraC-like DNA-binding protein